MSPIHRIDKDVNLHVKKTRKKFVQIQKIIYRTGLDSVKERGLCNPAILSIEIAEGFAMTERKKTIPGGLLIAIEGIDGSGKSTQAALLCKALSQKGYDAIYLKEPTDGPYGRKIRALAIEGRHEITPLEEFELFRKDRIQDVEENIKPALQSGKIVVIDRYFYSSIAYQGALGLDPEFINRENRKIAICPDLLIYLSIPASLSTDRIEQNRGDSVNLFEKMEYLENVKAIFDAMNYPEKWTVDGTVPIDEIHRTILFHVSLLINKRLQKYSI